MTAEKEPEAEPATIVECDPPRHLVVDLGAGDTAWRLAVTLAEADGITTLTFTQVVTGDVDVSDVGPGWEFYLDRLAAAEAGDQLPDFDDDGYLAAMQAHYAAQ